MYAERGESRELPGARIRRIADTLSFYDADVLVTGGLDPLWAAVVDAGADPKEAANVLSNQFVAAGIDPGAVEPKELAKLVTARAEIPRATFDEALARVIDRVIAANPGQAEAYRGGKAGLLGFFVGQVMKETGGKADPRVVNDRVRSKLS